MPGVTDEQQTSLPPMQQAGPLPPGMEPPLLVEAREGEAKTYTRDPRKVYVDPAAESLEHTSRICYREVALVAEIRQRFPEFAAHIQAETDLYADRTAAVRFNNADAYGAIDQIDA